MRTKILVVGCVFLMLVSCTTPTPGESMPEPALTSTSTGTHKPTASFTHTPSATPTFTPTPVSPVFTGRILALIAYDLIEFSPLPTSVAVQSTQIASDVVEAALSPDANWLVYSTFTPSLAGRSTHLFGVQERSDELLLPHNASTIRWSPDSQYFSYLVEKGSDSPDGLYLFNVAARSARLVYEPPCAGYGLTNTRGVCGAIRGMEWVTPGMLVFQRYKGLMPETISSLQLELPDNTTTFLKVSGGGGALVDSPQRWFVEDRCADQVLLREETETATYFSVIDTASFISHPGSIQPVQVLGCQNDTNTCLPLPESWMVGRPSTPLVGYLPGSCDIFYFSGEKSNPLIHRLVPGNLEDVSLPFPVRVGLLSFPINFAWQGEMDAPGASLAVLQYGHSPRIEIVNLQTGQISQVWSDPSATNNGLDLIGWFMP
jgi:hypothetical protein